MRVSAVEQGHLALGEQEQGDDLVFRLHNVQNVQNVQNVHMEYDGVTRGYKMYTKNDSLSTSNLHQLFWS